MTTDAAGVQIDLFKTNGSSPPRTAAARWIAYAGGLLIFFVAGCAVSTGPERWVAPAGSNFARDSYECERDARGGAPFMDLWYPGERNADIQRMYDKCMEARGYSAR
jgi:hypothetical protein